MKTDNIERFLKSFGKYIIKQSRTNLTKGKKNVTKDLYDSLNFKIITDNKGFTIEFSMAEYGTFVDKGVSGNQNKRQYKDYMGKKVPSPYKYTTRQPPSGILEKWISARGLKGRDARGRYITNKSFAFLIARSIKAKGIKGISFFQRPMELGLKRFGSDLLNALKGDISESLNKTIVK
ncbi:MAG: hypothetical protein Unbinned3065contig1007_3 [Prokaryotic dsDNA virus sp.]|nr:MAG: hypothetical protein Unbinned3065contig1007_3 [Prokaryotic dsDNA virus sp.]